MSKVKAHTRNVNGRKVTVTEHDRIGLAKLKGKLAGRRRGGHRSKGSKPKSGLARAAWGNVKKAWKHRNSKKAVIGFGLLAIVEITAYLSLNAVAFSLVAIATIAIGTAVAAV
ncbi:MAG: hypothetical protein ACRDTJ_22475, partial [Pseudonocardiaceae bacterium]